MGGRDNFAQVLIHLACHFLGHSQILVPVQLIQSRPRGSWLRSDRGPSV